MQRREFLAKGGGVALGFSLLPLGALPRADRARQASLIGDLEDLLPRLMEANLVPGLSVALIKEGKLLWRRGFGFSDSAARKPIDNDTVFEAASMSKPVFAYAVMKLCERGSLNLDMPL